jgi:hypothetical protein
MQLRNYLPLVALSLASATSHALPPNASRTLRGGANHHTGDDGFVAALGRAPRPGEEKLRMHEHFVAVRARLAAKPATKPELEAKRQQILAYLDAYIAKGTTPDNTHLPWSTPVFIDDSGTICAVGYLIEQSAGRPLADKIAETHRYNFIEDIAKAMPEVQQWVAESGFTLDELGQIQPGYPGPEVLTWRTWDLAKNTEIEDGAYEQDNLRGTIRDKQMEGVWSARNADHALLGMGVMHHGKGAWTSYYPTGARMATGGYVANRPDGMWHLYHESGNLAAEGHFVRGKRSGAWRFYYDTAEPTPIATGSFRNNGYVTGTWKHYDGKGGLLATSVVETPPQWNREKDLFWSVGYLLDVVPDATQIHHQIHQGSIDGSQLRLDALATADGKERVYLHGEDVFDRDGHMLVQDDGGWRADDCHWGQARKQAAKAGDVAALHGLIFKAKDEACSEGKLVTRARAQRITKLVDSMQAVRSASPDFIQDLALGKQEPDLMNVLAANMSLDIEWPHVDLRFVRLFETLPGYSR